MNQCAKISCPDLDRLIRFLDIHQDRGVVLSTIHMGDFLQSLFQICCLQKGRHVSIIRRVAEGDLELRMFGKHGQNGKSYDVIRVDDPAAGLKILRTLKKKGLVVMLYDLPDQFGKAMKLSFLDKQVEWVQGPAYFAARTDSLLVTFVSFRDQAGEARCELLPVISSNQGLKLDVVERAQCLADAATEYVRKYPEQWFQWSSFGEMLVTNDD